jgi:DNA-binding NtrC family response regulator
MTLAEIERLHILETFDRLGGNVTHTANALGIDRRTLQRKLRGYGREPADD